MINWIENILDWIYKKKCYICSSSKESVLVCSECYEKMEHQFLSEPKIIDEVRVYCAGSYENEIQKLIRGLKYHKQKKLAYFLAKFMFEYAKTLDFFDEDFVIIPVPLYKNREKNRGYNHMNLIADEFSKLCGKEVLKNCIFRKKDTKPQYKLNQNQRRENLKDAFVVDKNKLPDKKILIIDDISTTGVTFESMIKEFKKNGQNNIVCLALSTPY